MGKPSRRSLQAFVFGVTWMIAAAVPAHGIAVAYLPDDTAARQVTSGELDARFVAMPGPAQVREGEREPHWWRVTATTEVSAATSPQLLLAAPHLSHAEVWRPGDTQPLRRALTGPYADRNFAPRALVFPLDRGLRSGQHVYLRVNPVGALPLSMPVSIEPLAQVHRQDLLYVAWRAAILATMGVLAMLAFGFWLGIGERSYGYLGLALLAQAGYLASVGGELRVLPWLDTLALGEPGLSRLCGMFAVTASIGFLGVYLDLPRRQPRVMALMRWCGAVTVLGVLLSLVELHVTALLINAAILALTALIFVATGTGIVRGQRAARFLLVSWLPLMVFASLRIIELFSGWKGLAWQDHALQASFALSGLILTIGLADHVRQLRKDRDRASRLASLDTLTGIASRPMIEQQLGEAVADSRQRDQPLSVVFFDIDHFKAINDAHGHLVGDQCLRIIALRTRNRLRIDDHLGRFGGDEMLAVLPNTRLEDAIHVAENLRDTVNCRPLSVDGRLVRASLSLGVAELGLGETSVGLLERADAALYASKSAGRDRVSHEVPILEAEICP